MIPLDLDRLSDAAFAELRALVDSPGVRALPVILASGMAVHFQDVGDLRSFLARTAEDRRTLIGD